jgi:adenylylsulfate kinase-like enzyme
MTKKNDATGGVIWISGYSAAGKTTIGRSVNKLLQSEGRSSIFLDGDQLRSIFAHKWGYSKDERIELACTYFRLCSHLSKQGCVVVISAVAMFDEAREWFNQNVENGLEVYLKVPLDIRVSRDEKTKGIYKKAAQDMKAYTEPSNPDVVIENYGDMTASAASRQILEAFVKKFSHFSTDYGRTEYWAHYYKQAGSAESPSLFAQYCMPLFENRTRILEIGCGNGRDAKYFLNQNLDVVAIDKSSAAINQCKAAIKSERIQFIACEAPQLIEQNLKPFEVIYSRFSLHAMTISEENATLHAASQLIEKNGLLCIECRSINDPLAYKGEVLSPSERLNGHYRRFIVLEELLDKLTKNGFSITYSQESTGFAPYKDEDPMVIRVIVKKN